MNIRTPVTKPKAADLTGLITADELRFQVDSRYHGLTHAQMGDALGVTGSFVGMVLSGAREPSEAFLKATGFERVTLYRRKRRS